MEQEVTVYGRVEAADNATTPPAGSYSDTVTVEVRLLRIMQALLARWRLQLSVRSSWRLHRLRGLLLAVLLGVSALPAAAAGLSVAPTLLEFAHGETAKGLTLRNTGAAPLQVQVRVFDWRQENGEDILEPSTGLVVSPPFLRGLPAAGRWYVSCSAEAPPRKRRPASAASASWWMKCLRASVRRRRRQAGRAAPSGVRPGLNFLMRFSIPVFVAACRRCP